MPGVQDRDAVEVAGLRVDVTDRDQLVEQIMSWTEDADRVRTAVGVNAHVCNLAAREREFRSLVRAADVAYADGQSVVWASRLLGVRMPERVATTDLVFPLAEACARRGKRIFLFGSAPGIADRAAARLESLYTGLTVATSHGYVPDQDMSELVARMNSSGAEVLFVGLGDPLQQQWIETNRHRLQAKVVLSCGGLLDWTAGVHRRPPAWMISAGLEWFWRVLLEPRRLATRYLVGNPEFIARLLHQVMSERLARTKTRSDRRLRTGRPQAIVHAWSPRRDGRARSGRST